MTLLKGGVGDMGGGGFVCVCVRVYVPMMTVCVAPPHPPTHHPRYSIDLYTFSYMSP
jgi:hypothetical protein